MLALELLRAHVLDESIPLSRVLREAYIAARELKEEEFLSWVERELNGYDLPYVKGQPAPDWFPKYRRPGGRLMGEGAMGIRKPIAMPHHIEVYDLLTQPPLLNPVSELEEMAKDGVVAMELDPRNAAALRPAIGNIRPYVEYAPATFRGMLAGARQELLRRVMDAEEKFSALEAGIDRAQADELLRKEGALRRGSSAGDRVNAFLNENAWTTRLIADLMRVAFGVGP